MSKAFDRRRIGRAPPNRLHDVVSHSSSGLHVGLATLLAGWDSDVALGPDARSSSTCSNLWLEDLFGPCSRMGVVFFPPPPAS